MAMIRVPMRDGRAIHVRVVGRGRPTVMLAGLGMTSAHWLPLVAPFLASHRFYMPDYRGFGASIDVPARRGDLFDGHAADVADVIAHFGLRDHALVGYSLGASTSLHLQRSRGFEGVRGYLHIDQSPYVGTSSDWRYGLLGDRQPEVSAVLGRARDLLDAHVDVDSVTDLPAPARAELARTIGGLAPFLGGRGLLEPSLRAVFAMPQAVASRLPLMRREHLRTVLDAYARCEHDYRASLRGCETPITVVVGMRSSLYDPRGQAAIADYAPNATVERFEDAGHLAPYESPARFHGVLRRFLDAR